MISSSPRRSPRPRTSCSVWLAVALLGCDASTDATTPDGNPTPVADIGLDATAELFDATTEPDADAAPPDPDALPVDMGSDLVPFDQGPDLGELPDGFDGWTRDEIRILLGYAGLPRLRPDPTNRVADDPAAARFGHRLFFREDLSPTGFGCTFCHEPELAYSKALTYDGYGGLNFRAVPPLVNAAYHDWFFWDGRRDTQWAQSQTPLEAHDEIATDRIFIARAIAAAPELREPYEALFGPLPDLDDAERFPPRGTPFPNPDNPEINDAWAAMSPDAQHEATTVLANVGKSLAAFQRTLIAGDSLFDRYVFALRDENRAVAAAYPDGAKQGIRVFMFDAGCNNCHSGPFFSDSRFHNIGLEQLPGAPPDEGRQAGIAKVLADELNAAGPFSDAPNGRRARRLQNLRPGPTDLGAFKTASLRNITKTAPYAHNGRYRNLFAMIRYKLLLDHEPAIGEVDPLLLPYPAEQAEVLAIAAFLQTLESAPLPAELLGPPAD